MNASQRNVLVDTKIKNYNQTSIKPFLRWAGGKQNLVHELIKHIPTKSFNNYFEPFLGAGSLFFQGNFKKAILSDINPHLINCYEIIKADPINLYSRLKYHKKKVNSEYYYKQRDKFNQLRSEFTLEQAARFIFLIHSSFNGIYRVNRKGEYNVPFGKPNPAIPQLSHLLTVQSKLKYVNLETAMYEDIIDQIHGNDFVYFDPPYPPINQTSFFQHYSINKFPESQQVELSHKAAFLADKGALVMISNAETSMIKKLYKNWNLFKIPALRYVNCKSDRKIVSELIITNY